MVTFMGGGGMCALSSPFFTPLVLWLVVRLQAATSGFLIPGDVHYQ